MLYIVVVDQDEEDKGKESFRYTRPVLQSTLQLMGCKARHAFKVTSTFSLSLNFFFFCFLFIHVCYCFIEENFDLCMLGICISICIFLISKEFWWKRVRFGGRSGLHVTCSVNFLDFFVFFFFFFELFHVITCNSFIISYSIPQCIMPVHDDLVFIY